MVSRRTVLGGLAGAFAASTAPSYAQDFCSVLTPQTQSVFSPADAVAVLKVGNERFKSGETLNCNLLQQVRDTADHQSPIAAIVGCIDSRVPPELIFDQRIGDIFTARVAGNFANTDIIGSLEYATQVAGAKAIVVLGHTGCGAIKSAIDGVELGNITALLSNLAPAIGNVTFFGEKSSKNKDLVAKVTEANVRLTVATIAERSPVIQALIDAKAVTIVGAIHDIATGNVTWLT
jgi:carbonic anhydrase